MEVYQRPAAFGTRETRDLAGEQDGDGLIPLGDEGGDGPTQMEGYPMAWFILIIAGLLEVGWAVGLKYTEGFTKLWPSVATAVALIGSMGLLGVALRTLPLGTAYAVWTGIGTIGTAILGILLFDEPATVMRLVCIGLIVAGIVGLKVASA